MSASTPLRFDPSLEHEKPNEAETNKDLVETLRGIVRTTNANYGHAVRSVHAKSHAILEGELVVAPGLAPELAQGAFAKPGTFPVVMRVSTNPGDILDDGVSVPRGLAVKIIGVEGERLPGAEGEVTQDFVMANGPVFSAPDAEAFLKTLKLLAGTTDHGEGLKQVLSTALRGVNAALGSVGLKSGTVTALGGQPLTHPLGETFWSQTPFRWGDYVAKVSVAPVSPNLVALVGKPISLDGNPNALRQAAIDAMASEGGEWEVRVQLLTDRESMPVEDASVPWPEEESPYRPVGRIRVAAQPAWNEARAERVDDKLAFAPWHGLAAHQPLGSINRARRPAYKDSAGLRAELNGDTIAEPTGKLGLPGGLAETFGTTPGREGFRNARPKPETPPQRPASRGIGALAGLAGGVAAGLVVSALLLSKQGMTGRESDFVRVGRAVRQRGRRLVGQESRGGEAKAYAAHLLLAGATGAAYGAAKPEAASPVMSGLAFGAGLAAVHQAGVAAYGSAKGVGAPFKAVARQDRGTLAVQHVLVNTLFGVVTALVADSAGRALRRRAK